jgi:hypothetical protein
MKNFALRFLALVWLLPLFVSCNVYEPLTSISGDETLRQAAQVCLHKGDFTCAIEYLNRLSDSAEKQQDLCTVTLAQSGVTLVTMVNTIAKGSTGTKLMGNLAQALSPWTSDKETYAASAKTRCAAIPAATTASGNNLSTLLKALGYMADCSVRMAKTDLFVATAASGSCTATAGNSNGVVEANDIASDSVAGTLGAGQKGMCDADATLCKEDIDALSGMSTALRAAGLGDIAGNVDSIPNGATNSLLRVALRGTTSH